MVENKDLKCFVRVAKNGAKYRACLPKTDTPYKKKQDLRKNPHSDGKRKQPRQLAYPSGRTAKEKRENDKKTGVDSGRAVIMRRWQKKIDAEDTKEGKAEMSKRRNKVLAKYEKDKKGKAKDKKSVEDAKKKNAKMVEDSKKPVKFKIKKKEEPKKKPKLKIVKKFASGNNTKTFTTGAGKKITFKVKPKK